MAEQYRAQWEHSDKTPDLRVAEAARNWVSKKHRYDLPSEGDNYDLTFKTPRGVLCNAILDVDSQEQYGNRSAVFRLTEEHKDGERWRTEIVALSSDQDSNSCYYCSVATEQPNPNSKIVIAAPRIAKDLLSGAVTDNWPLDPQAMIIDDLTTPILKEAVANPSRRVPFIILRGSDDGRDKAFVKDIGTEIASSLAGLCSVIIADEHIDTELVALTNASRPVIPESSVRIFHPTADANDLASRLHPLRKLRSKNVIKEWVTMQIAPRSVVRQPPIPIKIFLEEQRQREINSTGSEKAGPQEIERLRSRIQSLDNYVTELEVNHKRTIDELQYAGLEASEFMEEASARELQLSQLARSQRSIESAFQAALSYEPRLEAVLKERKIWPYNEDEASTHEDVAAIQASFSPETSADCFEAATSFLTEWLSIPEDAARSLEVLDESPSASSWATSSWRAFCSLAAYAEAKQNDQDNDVPDFWHWCKSGAPLHWPASDKKLAMKESQSTMNNQRYAELRKFPTPEGGRVEMQAHIKVVQGGGDNIPRIYFMYDDCIKKVRVGYFGPHRFVPNPSAS